MSQDNGPTSSASSSSPPPLLSPDVEQLRARGRSGSMPAALSTNITNTNVIHPLALTPTSERRRQSAPFLRTLEAEVMELAAASQTAATPSSSALSSPVPVSNANSSDEGEGGAPLSAPVRQQSGGVSVTKEDRPKSPAAALYIIKDTQNTLHLPDHTADPLVSTSEQVHVTTHETWPNNKKTRAASSISFGVTCHDGVFYFPLQYQPRLFDIVSVQEYTHTVLRLNYRLLINLQSYQKQTGRSRSRTKTTKFAVALIGALKTVLEEDNKAMYSRRGVLWSVRADNKGYPFVTVGWKKDPVNPPMPSVLTTSAVSADELNRELMRARGKAHKTFAHEQATFEECLTATPDLTGLGPGPTSTSATGAACCKCIIM